MRPVAHICSDFPTKFGIPRQSGLVDDLTATVVFEPEFREPEALRGIEGFSHLWLIWEFSQARRQEWSPTVRPPRLGGNIRLGVFATRSPFRPNPIGLSCVKLAAVERVEGLGTVLRVTGADLMDGTPILDIQTLCALCGLPSRRSGRICRPGTRLPIDGRLPAGAARPGAGGQAPSPEGSTGSRSQARLPAGPGPVYGLPFAGLEVRLPWRTERLTVRT